MLLIIIYFRQLHFFFCFASLLVLNFTAFLSQTGFDYPRVLQKATVSIIGREECSTRYSHSQSQYGPISDVEICAGGDHKDTCQVRQAYGTPTGQASPWPLVQWGTQARCLATRIFFTTHRRTIVSTGPTGTVFCFVCGAGRQWWPDGRHLRYAGGHHVLGRGLCRPPRRLLQHRQPRTKRFHS